MRHIALERERVKRGPHEVSGPTDGGTLRADVPLGMSRLWRDTQSRFTFVPFRAKV